MAEKYVGIIGGSGLYNMQGMEITEEREIKTPYGPPSDKMLIGTLDGTPVAFMPRHGRGHRLTPTEVNYRANIFAFKLLGVSHIISVTAVGSMKEEHDRGHVVIVDQFIDRTRLRPSTFFGEGLVAHVSFADPICPTLAEKLFQAGLAAGACVKNSGTYVCIEGPMFSTKAESKLFRSWGVDVIGMTCYQEAKLAREAEICYSTMAMVTDYDCWHEGEEIVDAQAVMNVMHKNVRTAQNIIKLAVPAVHAITAVCACNSALKNGIMTNPEVIPEAIKKKLAPIVGKYLK